MSEIVAELTALKGMKLPTGLSIQIRKSEDGVYTIHQLSKYHVVKEAEHSVSSCDIDVLIDFINSDKFTKGYAERYGIREVRKWECKH